MKTYQAREIRHIPKSTKIIFFLVGLFILAYGIYVINIHFLIVGGVFVLMTSFNRSCSVDGESVVMDYQSFLFFHRFKHLYFEDVVSIFKRPWEKDPEFVLVYFETDEMTIRLMFPKEEVDHMIEDVLELHPHIEDRSFVFEDEFEEMEEDQEA